MKHFRAFETTKITTEVSFDEK